MSLFGREHVMLEEVTVGGQPWAVPRPLVDALRRIVALEDESRPGPGQMHGPEYWSGVHEAAGIAREALGLGAWSP